MALARAIISSTLDPNAPQISLLQHFIKNRLILFINYSLFNQAGEQNLSEQNHDGRAQERFETATIVDFF